VSAAARGRRIAICATSALALSVGVARAQTASVTYPIDLPTALRLAGAQNLDVQIALRAVDEAEADRLTAIEQFFPWLGLGATYHRRDGFTQAVPAGTVSKTNLDSYAPGGTLTAQVALGDALYNTLAARQRVRASDQALEAQRQESTLQAAQGYLELAKARALVDVARQALETSQDYQNQLHEAVAVGVAFKGDELRVETQSGLYRIAVRQALEAQCAAAASLAQILHLDPVVELVPQDTEVVPLALFEIDTSPEAVVQRALSARPELKQSRALVDAAREGRDGALLGPLIPSLGAQAFVGGFGGGHDGEPSHFGESEDYLVGVSWRIGPGGLFDLGRVDASDARLATLELGEAKLKDAISAEAVTSLSRAQSLSDQLEVAKQNLTTAGKTLDLTRRRKHFGVGIVLEDIQAQQALNQARADYVTKVAEFDEAQYGLIRAVGGPLAPQQP